MTATATAKQLLLAQSNGAPLDKDIVAVSVDGKTVDLHTPIPADSRITPIRASEPAGLRVIRHSTAHVMADAVQRLFPGTKVTIGPAIDDGFFYDFAKPEGTFTEEDLATIEKKMIEIVKANSPFRRDTTTREEALETFGKMGETFKQEIIRAIPEGEEISIYRHGRANDPSGEWFDVCEGPHVPTTGYLKAVKLQSVAGAYWRGDEKNPMLQRIYGTAFATKEELEAHLKNLEDAKARDHRKLGKELDLFLFDQVSPAMPFFLPKGAFVYNQMVQYIRGLYDTHGYEEVITPQIFDPKLFRTSGHLGNYNENMYRLWTEDLLAHDEQDAGKAQAKGGPGSGSSPDKTADSEAKSFHAELQKESFALKPMNCPSHCVIFGSRRRSYRELPWRMADFGRLHRYERGGVVHGLSRVRSFSQDDGHIFCTEDQVAGEIADFMKLLHEVYQAFTFDKIDIKLATRPDKRIGSDELWDRSEKALQTGLEQAGLAFEILPGEGAFYGPKIEFHVQDALKRSWQLGTVQYDPNLPERFDLTYTGADGQPHRPVMLHRAVLGSVERFFSVYLEHCGGNFPTWISPRQVMVISVTEVANEYAQRVHRELKALGFRVDLDDGQDKLGAKIRNARLARYPYLCVVGVKEAESEAVGVRSRDRGELGALPLREFVSMLTAEARTPRSAGSK
jgi:threonyl-tRNA synthetase